MLENYEVVKGKVHIHCKSKLDLGSNFLCRLEEAIALGCHDLHCCHKSTLANITDLNTSLSIEDNLIKVSSRLVVVGDVKRENGITIVDSS